MLNPIKNLISTVKNRKYVQLFSILNNFITFDDYAELKRVRNETRYQ